MSDPLLELLLEHVGRSSAIPASEIAKRLRIDDTGGSPVTRRLIAELVQRGFPVAADTHGYFICASQAEAEGYLDSLRQRSEEIDARAAMFRRAWCVTGPVKDSAPLPTPLPPPAAKLTWAPADADEREL
jgi:hypothetical protein